MTAPVNPFLAGVNRLFALWGLGWWQEWCQQGPFGFGQATKIQQRRGAAKQPPGYGRCAEADLTLTSLALRA